MEQGEEFPEVIKAGIDHIAGNDEEIGLKATDLPDDTLQHPLPVDQSKMEIGDLHNPQPLDLRG